MPVLCVRVAVVSGALESAYVAADKPFPTRCRHTWVHEPGAASWATPKREASSRFRTVAHQQRDRAFQPDPFLPPPRDTDLGQTGCLFDMNAHDTDFFGVQRYFLTLNAAPSTRERAVGATSVVVSASIVLRTVAPPKADVLRAQAAAKTLLSGQQQQSRASAAAAKALAAEQAASQLAAAKEAQRLADQAAAQKRAAEDLHAAETSVALASARASRALAQAQVLAGEEPSASQDPFAEAASTSGTPLQRHSRALSDAEQDRLEQKYADPFGDEPSDSRRPPPAATRSDDPFANMDDDDEAKPSAATTATAADPFSSFPPSPRRPAAAGAAAAGRNPLDELDSLPSSPKRASAASAAAVASRAAPSRRVVADTVNTALERATRPAGPALSPNELESLASRRPSPAATPTAANSLSLASTPIVKPVKRDPRVLDNLPSLAPPVSLHVPPRSSAASAARPLARAELSVSLNSLPDRAAIVKPVDVLAGVPTPQLSPRAKAKARSSAAAAAAEPTLSRMPTPVLRPQIQPSLLDSVVAPAIVRPNPRALDSVPSPALSSASRRPKLAQDLDALPLPVLHLAAPITAPPAGPNALDESFGDGDGAAPAAAAAATAALAAPTTKRPAVAQPAIVAPAKLPPNKRTPQKPVQQQQPQKQPQAAAVAADLFEDSSDSLFGSGGSPQRPTRRVASAANPLDDDLLWDAPLPRALPRAPPVAATAALVSGSPLTFSGSLDDVNRSRDQPPRVKANLNVLDSL